MVKTFLLTALMIFALLGFCEFVYLLRMIFIYPSKRSKNYSLIVLKNGIALKQLNYIWQKIRWNGDAFSSGIIAITDSLDTDEILICKNFAANKHIVLCAASTAFQCKLLQGEFFDECR